MANLAGELCSTDIPDWVISEGGVEGDNFVVTAENMAKLYARSPICHVLKVSCPVLLLIGTLDRRVPCAQSYEYYHALRGRGISTKLLQYKARHALADSARENCNGWLNIARWFCQCPDF